LTFVIHDAELIFERVGWGVNTGCEYKSGYDDLIRPQLEPKGYSPRHRRVRTTETPVPAPDLNAQLVEEKQSEEESDDDPLLTWSSSPERPLRRLNDEPPDSSLPGKPLPESRNCRETTSREEDEEDKDEDGSEASDAVEVGDAAAETSEVDKELEEQQDEVDKQSAKVDAQPQEEAELNDAAVKPSIAASKSDEVNEQAQAKRTEKIPNNGEKEATLASQGITMGIAPQRVFVEIATPASEHVALALGSDDDERARSRRVTRARNGIVKRHSSSGATKPKVHTSISRIASTWLIRIGYKEAASSRPTTN
jgi:hypothetical protein